MADRSPRLSIVSQYPALRAGLRALLGGEGFAVVSEAGSIEALLADSPLETADAVVVDPAQADVELLIEHAAEMPSLRPLVLGPLLQPDRLSAAMAGRAWGYVPRDAGSGLLAGAARAVAEGLVAVDPSLSASLGTPQRAAVDDPDAEVLTSRERQVLALVAAGLANKEIARQLKISEHTVKFHVAAILAKLGAQSRTEAGYLAARRGLIAL
jgi:two-component system nitrate/nitrite response regulator NarL